MIIISEVNGAMISRRPMVAEPGGLPRGALLVRMNHCKGCRFCIEFCPKEVLEESTAMNRRGYHYPVIARGQEEGCVNCQFCTIVCPEFAIFSEEWASEKAPYTLLNS